MAEIISRDTVAPEKAENVSPGNYTIEEITFAPKSLDGTTNKPCLVDSDWGTHDVHLLIKPREKEEGKIRLYLNYNLLPFLVEACSGNAKELPPLPSVNQPTVLTNYLTLAVEMCNEGNKEASIQVKKDGVGVYYSFGLVIPSSSYYIFASRIDTQIDKTLSLGSSTYKDSTQKNYHYPVTFTIVANRAGKANGWSGTSFKLKYVPYQLRVVDDNFEWVLGNNGTPSGLSIYSSNFISTTMPSLLERNEKGNMELTTTKFNDLNNPLPTMQEAIQESKVLFFATIGSTPNGLYNTMDMSTMEKADDGDVDKELRERMMALAYPSQIAVRNGNTALPIQVPQASPTVRPQTKIITDLLSILAGDNLFPNFPVIQMTEQIKAILAKYIKPLTENKKLSTKDLKNLSTPDLRVIMDSLFDVPNDDFDFKEPNNEKALSELHIRIATLEKEEDSEEVLF